MTRHYWLQNALIISFPTISRIRSLLIATRRLEYKTNKAALLHFFMDSVQEDMPNLKGSLHIKDGKALFHALINASPTFGEICLKVLVHVVTNKEFIFSADSYHADSSKSQEYTMPRLNN